MYKGVVKKWNEEKGYGFLLPEGGGENVFVHRAALVAECSLSPGDSVTFDQEDDGKGRGKFKALNVEVITTAGGGGLFEDLPFPCAVDTEHSDSVCGSVEMFCELAGDASTADELEAFIVHSTLHCPFLVVSDGQLVESCQVPSPSQLSHLLNLVNKYITGCEEQGAVMIADFEGEMPGHGGVLTIAQLQLTSAVDGHTLQPQPSQPWPPRSLGLLIDLRSETCVAVMRRVMESSRIVKLLWGAGGDFKSLLYQQVPIALRVQPSATVDVMKAFHSLGMAEMMKHLHPERLAGLPSKQQIDFDAFHSLNCQALPPPIGLHAAKYAMDDLHRIELILQSKVPSGGSLLQAKDATDKMLLELLADPCGLQSLRAEMRRFQQRSGAGQTCKAVEMMRHIISLRIRGMDAGPEQVFIEEVETSAKAHLQSVGVVIPTDLSFSIQET